MSEWFLNAGCGASKHVQAFAIHWRTEGMPLTYMSVKCRHKLSFISRKHWPEGSGWLCARPLLLYSICMVTSFQGGIDAACCSCSHLQHPASQTQRYTDLKAASIRAFCGTLAMCHRTNSVAAQYVQFMDLFGSRRHNVHLVFTFQVGIMHCKGKPDLITQSRSP
jgi:hypothetical protein